MTEPLLYRPTYEELAAFDLVWSMTVYMDDAMPLAFNQAQRTGKTAFACYLAIARSLSLTRELETVP